MRAAKPTAIDACSENSVTDRAAPANHTLRLMVVITANRLPKLHEGIRGGTTRHIQRKMAFSNMPTGTIPIAGSNASEFGSASHMKAAAGTMVVGMVPRIPPTTPPNFSIATVTAIATKPARNAASRIWACASIQIP